MECEGIVTHSGQLFFHHIKVDQTIASKENLQVLATLALGTTLRPFFHLLLSIMETPLGLPFCTMGI